MVSPALLSDKSNGSSAVQRPGRSVVWLAAGVILAAAVAVVIALLLLRSQALSDARKRNEALGHAIEEQTVRTLQTVDLRLQIAAASGTGRPAS